MVIACEMTTNVRFCLSYDPFKWDSIAFKMGNISRRKRTFSMTLRLRAKVLLHVWSYDFYDIEDIYSFEVKAKYISSNVMKISANSRVRSTSGISDIFNT